MAQRQSDDTADVGVHRLHFHFALGDIVHRFHQTDVAGADQIVPQIGDTRDLPDQGVRLDHDQGHVADDQGFARRRRPRRQPPGIVRYSVRCAMLSCRGSDPVNAPEVLGEEPTSLAGFGRVVVLVPFRVEDAAVVVGDRVTRSEGRRLQSRRGWFESLGRSAARHACPVNKCNSGPLGTSP